MSVKVKGAKGGFVFRPIYLIPGIFVLYLVHYLDQYGMISVLPQVLLGLMGGRWFIKGIYESNNKRFREYQKEQKDRRMNRSFLSLLLVFAMFGVIMSGSGVMAVSPYWNVRTFTTEDLDSGYKYNVWTNTDNETIANETFRMAYDDIIFTEGFEDYSTGPGMPDNWGLVEGLDDVQISNVHTVSGNNSLLLDPVTVDLGVYYGDDIDNHRFSFWAYFPNEAVDFDVLTYSSDGLFRTSQGAIAYIKFDTEGNIQNFYYEIDGSNFKWKDSGFDYTAGWHFIELQDSLEHKTFDLWYDGTLVIEEGRSYCPYDSQMEDVSYINLVACEEPVWIDDVQIGADEYYKRGSWQSPNVLTDAWIIEPHSGDICVEVTDAEAATGEKSIYIHDNQNGQIVDMAHYFYPHMNITFEFDIKFTSTSAATIDKFYIWIRNIYGVRNVYFYLIQSTSSPGNFELRYFNGGNYLLGYLPDDMWYHMKCEVDDVNNIYNLYVDDASYLGIPFAYITSDGIGSIEFSTSGNGGVDSVYLDNIVFNTNNTEFVNDTFEEDEIGSYPSGGGLDAGHFVKMAYTNVSANAYIDKVSFLQPDPIFDGEFIEFAAYDKDIVRGEGINITEAKLTSGSFQDLNVSSWYFIKIYLASDGNSSCDVGPIGSEVIFRELDEFSYEEVDGYWGPVWGGSSVPTYEQPWYNQILLMLEENTGLLFAGVLLLLAVILLSGGKRRRR